MTNTVSKAAIKVDDAVAQSVQKVLVDTYGLFLATHNYHWNVEGPHFSSLHLMFEEQYTELFAAIDEIAERIRALGEYALPFEGAEIAALLKEISNPLLQAQGGEARAQLMIKNLITLNETVVESAQKAKSAAQDANDDESEDMMIARIQVHQKTLWMLKSLTQ